jgi:hypothetical protein
MPIVQTDDSRIGDMVPLYTKREQAFHTLQEVRGLLEKADRRRAEEKGSRRHWDDVLNHLERSLDEARFRLENLDTAIAKAEKLMSDEDVARAKAVAAGVENSLPSAPSPALSIDPVKAVEQVIRMSIDELRGLNMAQVALLHSQLPPVNVDLDTQPVPPPPRLELANQLRAVAPKTAPVSKLMEKRNQLVLRRCLHKASANRLNDITREEKVLLQTTYDMLHQKADPTVEDTRLARLLDAVMRKLSLA